MGWVGCRNPAQVLPVKKALKIGLSPCEERLCYEHFVDVDHILPLASAFVRFFWDWSFLWERIGTKVQTHGRCICR